MNINDIAGNASIRCIHCSHHIGPIYKYTEFLVDGVTYKGKVCLACDDQHNNTLHKIVIETIRKSQKNMGNSVDHPSHYTGHPSGIECIQITEHMNFCLGNAIKYIWRAGTKSDDPREDLRKAIWYLSREIERIGK